jgi:acetyl-CoA C-acetyltransferase
VLGHPLGMTGARLALTTAITMADEGREYGVATMCSGVVQGIATLFSRP